VTFTIIAPALLEVLIQETAVAAIAVVMVGAAVAGLLVARGGIERRQPRRSCAC